MKTLALVLIIIGIVAVVCFSIAFFVELAKSQENKEVKEEADNDNASMASENEVEEEVEKTEANEFDLDAMLAKLEASAQEETAQSSEEVQEGTVEEVSSEEVQEVSNEEVPTEEVQAETQPVEETVNETSAEEAIEAPVEEEKAEETVEVPVEEEKTEQTVETPVEEAQEEPSQEEVSEVTEETSDDSSNSKVIVIREHTTEVINNAQTPAVQEEAVEVNQEVVDLTTRLESVRASQAKVDNDLTKATREINKYERTERRMARNQKLLDKKAEDLTKLNLVLYSVTDIKNIDNDKKQKQEELVTHINELKTSIKDAQTYLDTNREKYENSQKMKEFFEGEKARLDADEKEILSLMGQAGSDSSDAE
ncbi:MAG: hypothetical protein IJT25_01535 [Clostridia bacterium]|nr:hypothetical protein [Clostridia bacterium]